MSEYVQYPMYAFVEDQTEIEDVNKVSTPDEVIRLWLFEIVKEVSYAATIPSMWFPGEFFEFLNWETAI